MKKSQMMIAQILMFLFVIWVESGTASEPVDISGFCWSFPVSVKVNVSRVGSFSGLTSLEFETQANPDTFSLTVLVDDEMAQEVTLSGTYSTQKGKIVITQDNIDPAELEQMIEDVVYLAVLENDEMSVWDYEIVSIEELTVQITAQGKSYLDKKNDNRETLGLSMNIKIGASIQVEYYDWEKDAWISASTKVSTTLKGSGYMNMFDPGLSSWNLEGQTNLQLSRGLLQKAENNTLILYLEDKPLQQDYARFSLDLGEGNQITGSYVLYQGKIYFYPDFAELRENIFLWIEEELLGFSEDLYFEPYEAAFRKISLTGKMKTNKKTGAQSLLITFSLNVEVGGIMWDDEFMDEHWLNAKGQFQVKAVGEVF
jgi:hypothetical protein